MAKRKPTVKDWIYFGIILVVCNFVVPPVLRWVGVPQDLWPGPDRVPPDVAMGLITVACVGVLIWFTWHVRRERRSPR